MQDKSVEGPKQVRISKGIPQSFMVKAEPGTKGAMLTSTGEYAIPAIDAYVSPKDKALQSSLAIVKVQCYADLFFS